jgi:hypothetical protein
LCPELQGRDVFAAGVDSIVEAQTRVARLYFDDGSVDAACPPLRALLHIMAQGHFEGKNETDPEIRAMFTRAFLIKSDWYKERLRVKQQRDIALWENHTVALEAFRASGIPADTVNIDNCLSTVREQLQRVSSPAYLGELMGTIGADPFHLQV